MWKIHSIRKSITTEPVQSLIKFLDTSAATDLMWYTYVVLHMDGENMSEYTNYSTQTYYKMINDPKIIKSIYVGRTVDSVFRRSHFIKKSSLSEIFSKTSKLFMLRSIKFDTMTLAKRDEAMAIVSNIMFSESLNLNTKKYII